MVNIVCQVGKTSDEGEVEGKEQKRSKSVRGGKVRCVALRCAALHSSRPVSSSLLFHSCSRPSLWLLWLLAGLHLTILHTSGSQLGWRLAHAHFYSISMSLPTFRYYPHLPGETIAPQLQATNAGHIHIHIHMQPCSFKILAREAKTSS